MEEVLNYSNWMCPKHCTPSEFFRGYVIICKLLVFFAYILFAYFVGIKLRKILDNLIIPHFGMLLSIVFVCCGFDYLIGAFSYIWIFPKLFYLPLLPILIITHTLLIIKSDNAFDKLNGLSTAEKVFCLKEENKTLLKERSITNIKIRQAIINKDMNILKDLIHGNNK